MRHLSTEELLLYANGELEDRGLCRHVVECVDCKAHLVDLQESYVLTTTAICEELPAPAPTPEQFAKLRTRLAAEAQLMHLHLSTEDLLISIEDSLSPELEAHLASCTSCQSRAADVHVQLASIEYELRRETAFELPLDRRAAALTALRGRLEEETATQQTASTRFWDWIPRVRPHLIPEITPHAAAFAGICLAVWLGWNAISTPDSPETVTVAQLSEPASASPTLATDLPRTVEQEITAQSSAVERFDWTGPEPRQIPPVGPRVLVTGTVPAVSAATRPNHTAPMALPQLDNLPEPQAPAPAAVLAQAVPETTSPAPPAAQTPAEVLADGNWMLIKAGLWKANLQTGGTPASIRFTGSVASERERIHAQEALFAVADGRPVEFEIAVRSSHVAASAVPAAVRASRTRSLGTTVRNSLLQHYRDAARRSFQPLERSTLENELDLYVSDVMRHDADLLAHVHALNNLVSRSDSAQVRDVDSFQRVVRYHLEGIAQNGAEIYSRLSEALPRRYWAYRGPRTKASHDGDLQAASKALLQDALALDQALSSLFFEGSDMLDVRESNLSSASLLEQLRQRTRQLRSAIR